MRPLGKAVRSGASALLLLTAAVRVIRVVENRRSVLEFYRGSGGAGLLWTILGSMIFLGPFLTAASAVWALWLSRERAGTLAALNFCVAGFFAFFEGLLIFARSMNGSTGYVGAEPLFSLFACAVSGGTALWAFCSQRREWRRKYKDKKEK